MALFGLLAACSSEGSGLSGKYVPAGQKTDMYETIEISGDTVIYVMTMRAGSSVAHRGEIKKMEKDENGLTSSSSTTAIEVTMGGSKLPSSLKVFAPEQRNDGQRVVLSYTDLIREVREVAAGPTGV